MITGDSRIWQWLKDLQELLRPSRKSIIVEHENLTLQTEDALISDIDEL